MDLEQISVGLSLGEEGIWIPRAGERDWPVSFPSQGHAECLQIEDESFWFRHRNACLLEGLRRFPPGGTIFELGAGNGFVASAFEKSGYPCVALEPGAEGAHNARRRGVDTVVCATLESAAFLAESLPAVGLFDVIEHIERDDSFLGEVARALARGGRLYATVPAYQWLWSDEDEVAGHFRRYTLGRIRRDLMRAGLSIEHSTYFFSSLVVPVFLRRTVPHLLRRRTTAPVSSATEQHAPRPGPLTRAVVRALDLELKWLRTGRTVPFGTSCFVVARKPE